MSELAVFNTGNLPSVQSLSTALRSIKQSDSGGHVIIKMDKTGHWVFGADQTEVEDGATWAINPFSFIHGYIAWGDGEVLGEKMVGITQPLPELDVAPGGAKRGWETQFGMSLKCLDGEDEGMEARYATTSVGGKKAVQELAVAIANQVEKDQDKPVPVVVLKKDHYTHKSYGKIFTPVFEIKSWLSMTGMAPEEEEADAPEPVEEKAAPRRRRRAS